MDELFLDQALHPTDDLSEDGNCSCLVRTVLAQVLRKVHIAILHHHEKRIALLGQVDQSDDVGVVELLHDGGLVLEGLTHPFLPLIDLLHRVGWGVVHPTESALAQDPLERVHVTTLSPNGLHHFSNIIPSSSILWISRRKIPIKL